MSELAPGLEIELDIESLAGGGDGIGRVDGQVVFVPRCAPGDRVRVELVRVQRRFARARLLEVLEAGPDRREPPCALAWACGGCAWMHLTESAQERARVDAVRDALERIGRTGELPEIEQLSSPALGYRARARLGYGGGVVGFRAAASHSVVDVDHCLVLDDSTQRELAEVRRERPRGTGEVEIRGYGERIRVGKHTYHVSPESFFQPNGALWEPWLDAVVEDCGQGDLLVELYAGVGFYTLPLLASFERVVAVERSRAVRDLTRNLLGDEGTSEGAGRVRVEHASCESFAPAELSSLSPDVVLLNPPRAGTHVDVCSALVAASPRRIVYVSCDAPTLARDIARLGETYCVKRVRVLHALPQTQHVEIICTLEQRASD